MAEPIPTRSREIVRSRDERRCVRCGAKGSDWHHRRTRHVRDEHRHCPCNGVYLCRTCHRWAHANPARAREVGIVVSAAMGFPYLVPVRAWDGWREHGCSGSATGLLAGEVQFPLPGSPRVPERGSGRRTAPSE